MRFIIFVIDDQTEKAGADEMAAIDEFNDMLQTKNHWITAAGINHGAAATILDNRAGAGIIKEGSLYVSAEHYSGFWLIEANDHDQALELAAAGSMACNRKIELRPCLG
jgi:hypothetical protein